jgi:hypothetical protein
VRLRTASDQFRRFFSRSGDRLPVPGWKEYWG